MGASNRLKILACITAMVFLLYIAIINRYSIPTKNLSNAILVPFKQVKAQINNEQTMDAQSTPVKTNSTSDLLSLAIENATTIQVETETNKSPHFLREKAQLDLHQEKVSKNADGSVSRDVLKTGARTPVQVKSVNEKKKTKVNQVKRNTGDLTTYELAQELRRKIENVPLDALMSLNETNTCGREEIKDYGCGESFKCHFRTSLPVSFETRINQLVLSRKLQIQPKHMQVIRSMSAQFKKRPKFLILSGASSNHFLEVQGMIRLIHTHVPLDVNYAIIIYDLGLTTEERAMMKKFCNCTLITFPFSDFPEHVSELYCYGWKPPIVYAHIVQAESVLWADASIRLKNGTHLRILLERLKERGVLQQAGGAPSVSSTVSEMYHYFGDEPCAYKPYRMLQATSGFYHNEPLIRQAVLVPWVACALSQQCICPKPPKEINACSGIGPRWERLYSKCHRFDQSAINVIMAKLFQTAVPYFSLQDRGYDVRRGEQVTYFDYLQKLRSKDPHVEHSLIIIPKQRLIKRKQPQKD